MIYSEEKIEKTLDEYVRPKLKEHYGNIVVTRIEGNVVYVKLTGRCASCASAQYTVEDTVKKILMQHFPEIRDVTIDTFNKELFQFAKRILNHEIDTQIVRNKSD